MKGLIISLTLLILTTLMVAAESAPSATVGYVKYECQQNSNLIALPMNSSYSTASGLGDTYSGKINAVSKWDAESQSWVTASKGALGWSNDFNIFPANGYMINTVQTFDFYSTGTVATSPIYNLQHGINMIMLPFEKTNINMASTLGDDISYSNAVSKWDAESQNWITASKGILGWSNDFPTVATTPYIISVTEETNWPSVK